MIKSAISAFNPVKNSGALTAQTDNEKLKMFQAQDPNADPEVLDALANDEKWNIRMTVAQNRRALPKTLDRLSQDNDFRVRCGVAANPNICASKDILDRLSDSNENIEVLRALTGNQKLPSVYLEKLSGTRDWQVLWGVGRHSNTYPETLDRLSKNPETLVGPKDAWLVKWGISENPKCPPEILTRFYDDENLFIRWAVAAHKNTPVKILQEYIDNPNENENVKKAAKENLKNRDIKTKTFNLTASAAPLYNLFRKKNV